MNVHGKRPRRRTGSSLLHNQRLVRAVVNLSSAATFKRTSGFENHPLFLSKQFPRIPLRGSVVSADGRMQSGTGEKWNGASGYAFELIKRNTEKRTQLRKYHEGDQIPACTGELHLASLQPVSHISPSGRSFWREKLCGIACRVML
ncbi:hypothetical protein ANANG_G00144650 [Anguilla anguilla]|uniref:Uncharacterized protein n=1 Tax=Anguilla anguilla TaxID=7936 RepID=A0A9D3RWQ5_ANGAN|nr:hypothetical protein ANANG_G00144650 [Anguilla anguilla]